MGVMKIHASRKEDFDSIAHQRRAEAWVGDEKIDVEDGRNQASESTHVRRQSFEMRSSQTNECPNSPPLNSDEPQSQGTHDQVPTGVSITPVINRDANTNRSALVTLAIRRETRIVQKNRTIFNLLVRNENVRKVLLKIYKNRIVSLVINLMWFFSTIMSLSYRFNIHLIPTSIYIPYQIIYSTNFCLHHSIFIRVDIIKELTKSFNFWFTIWNLVSFHVCLVLLWGLSTEIFCTTFHSLSSIFVLIFFDAHAGKRQRLMKLAVLNGTISYLPMVIILSFRLVAFQNEKLFFDPGNVQIMDVRLQALDNLTTMIIYLLRILYTHIILNKSNTIAFVSNYYEIVRGNNKATIETYRTSANQNQSVENRDDSQERDVEMQASASSPPPEMIVNNRIHQNYESNSQGKQFVQASIQDGHNQFLDTKQYLVAGIMESKIIQYNSRETIYHEFVKDRLPIFSNMVRSKSYNIIGVSANTVSAFISLPLAAGINIGLITEYIGTAIVGFSILYILAQMILTCNFFMFRHMIRSFDFWFVMFIISKGFFSSGILCEWDTRMVHWFFIVLALCWFTMIDTFHVNYRDVSYIALMGIAWCLAATTLCKLNVGSTFRRDRFLYWDGEQFLSANISLSSSAMSACIFFIRFLWSYHNNRNRILFITENIRVEQIVS